MRRLLVAPLAAGLAVATFGAGGAVAMTGSCSSGTIVKTPGYVFALSIGPMEKMYTPAQVKTTHPTGGEVMLAGKMVGGMAGMDMGGGGSQRHLEVHICTTAGTVVKSAHPAIMLNGAMVPVAVMQGVGEGASDLHYGNNVNLKTGQKVTVVVTLKGRKAVFHTTVSKSSSI